MVQEDPVDTVLVVLVVVSSVEQVAVQYSTMVVVVVPNLLAV